MIIRNQAQAPPIRVSRRAAPELTVNQTPSLRALARWLGEMLSPPLSGAEHARVARAILDGLANEDSPQAVAARIEQVADVDEARALAIAQTEMSRINRENQLDVLEQRKGGEDSLVRWRANAKACPRCKARDGETMTVAEARGVLPYHPHCSCKWVRVYAARTRNVFCPTGPGGGVDPTCKAGGETSDVLKAASSHVADSKSTTPEERAILKDAIQKSHTKRQRLQRVFSAKPNWSDGDIVDLDPTSFTGVNVLAGKNAGHIGWKDTDEAIAVVKHPRRGMDVDYSQLEAKASLVSPVEEQETILAGKYKVSVKRAPVPGTKKDSGWGYIRVYELEEVHDVGNTSRSSGARNTTTTTTLNSFFRSCARDAQGRCLPGTAGVAGRVAGNVKRKVLARYQKMEARYGRAGAIAVMAGIVATLPVPVPGSSFAVIGAAEGVRAAYRAVRKLRGKAVTPTPVTNAASFSFADLDAMVEDGWQLVRDIHREYNAELDPRFNRLALRKAIMRELAEQTANVFCPTGKGGGVDPTCKTERGKGAPTTAKEAAVKFPKAGQRVAGLRVSKRVPEKETQIESFRGVTGGRMKVIGVREVPMTAMHRTGLGAVDSPPADPKAKTRWEAYRKRIASLAGHIKRTGVVEPPIVVYDGSDKGSYTLDGDHRIAALRLLGAESFPALVLVDLSRGRVQPAGKGINNWRQFRLMTSNSTVANAFCPTGKGGGVDPTCKARGDMLSSDPTTWKRGEEPKLTKDFFQSLPIKPRYEKGDVVLVWGSFGAVRGVVDHYDTTGPDSTDPEIRVTHPQNAKDGIYMSSRRAKFIRLMPASVTSNVFCPTGAGGGIDPSCKAAEKTHYAIERKAPGFMTIDVKRQGEDEFDTVEIGINQPLSVVRRQVEIERQVFGKGLLYKNNLYTWAESDSLATHHDRVAKELGVPDGAAKIYFQLQKGFVEVRTDKRETIGDLAAFYPGTTPTVNTAKT